MCFQWSTLRRGTADPERPSRDFPDAHLARGVREEGAALQ